MVEKMYKFLTHSSILKRSIQLLLLLISCLALLSLTACKEDFHGMLNPKGLIALQERKLFFDTLALMLIVVIPVIIMSFTFVYHYQKSHKIRDYKPNWSHSHFLESIWWGIPCVIILILAVMTWKTSHELDPYRPIPGQTQKPMLVQAIALPWKWLFIYPEYNIATVNYLEIPVNQEVEYWITTDNVPMSALFIPQLGSQIYTMTGMRTRLHLLATQTGVFDGLNTQFNGDGFSDMHFDVHVVDANEMQNWVKETKKSANHLTDDIYNKLLIPSEGDKPQFFSGTPEDLFDNVIALYMNSLGPAHPRENISKIHKE